ncbi:hypothetical protein [Klebsiella variicola]|uniref:hypothetical protein n=1 Tax=Klebsiella variicola TaxID=244366 RepID=UPI0013C339C4|nr:hypothetical protein [Klebsiella variicola]
MATAIKKPLKERKSAKSEEMPQVMEIPAYFQHVTENIIATESGDLMVSFVIPGMPYQATEDINLYQQFTKMKDFLVSIGSQYGNRMGLWTHFIKRKRTLTTKYKSSSTFCNRFYDAYCATFGGEEFYSNEYRLTLILKSLRGEPLDDAIKTMESVINRTTKFLKPFGASVLGVKEVANENTIYYRSEIGEFFITSSTIAKGL